MHGNTVKEGKIICKTHKSPQSYMRFAGKVAFGRRAQPPFEHIEMRVKHVEWGLGRFRERSRTQKCSQILSVSVVSSTWC